MSGEADELTHRYGVPFTEFEGEPVVLDVHAPAGARDLPVLVWFHGGGWSTGDSRINERKNLWQFAAAGAVVVSVDYTLSTRAEWPRQLIEGRAAVDWAAEHARELGGDPERLFIGGGSAGGHISLLLGLTLGKHYEGVPDSRAHPHGVVAIYPVIDPLRFDREQRAQGEPARGTFAHGSWTEYPDEWGRRGRLLLGEDGNGTVVPFAATEVEDPPREVRYLFVHGTGDSEVDYRHSLDGHRLLSGQGVRSTLLLLPDADHGSWDLHRGIALAAIHEFLSAR